MYKVLKDFIDLKDDNYLYHKGDVYPRDGAEIGNERLLELSTKDNKIGEILIEAVDEPKKEATKEAKPKKAKKKE